MWILTPKTAKTPILIQKRIKLIFHCELDQHDRDGARKLLDRLVELCEADGVAIVQAAYLWNCEVLQSRRPSIRINATIGLTDEETVYAANVIKRNSVICRREYDIQNGDEVTPQRPTSLSLRSDAGTGQLLSSPVLEARPAFPSRRVRTYSGSGNNANKRIIKTRNLSSGEESSDDANEESVSINQNWVLSSEWFSGSFDVYSYFKSCLFIVQLESQFSDNLFFIDKC